MKWDWSKYKYIGFVHKLGRTLISYEYKDKVHEYDTQNHGHFVSSSLDKITKLRNEKRSFWKELRSLARWIVSKDTRNVYVIRTGDGDDGNEYAWHSVWSSQEKAEAELRTIQKLSDNFNGAEIVEYTVDEMTYVYNRRPKL